MRTRLNQAERTARKRHRHKPELIVLYVIDGQAYENYGEQDQRQVTLEERMAWAQDPNKQVLIVEYVEMDLTPEGIENADRT